MKKINCKEIRDEAVRNQIISTEVEENSEKIKTYLALDNLKKAKYCVKEGNACYKARNYKQAVQSYEFALAFKILPQTYVEPIKHILEEIAKIPSHLLSQASAPQIDNFIPEKKAFIKYVEEGNKYYNHLNYQPPQKVNAQAPPTIIDLTNDETKQGIITFAPNLINPVSLPEDWNKINAYLNSPPEVEAEYWIAEGWTYYEQQNYDLAIKMYQAALSLQGLPESYREFIINSINSIVNISKTSSQPLLVNTKADTAAKTPVLNPLICCSIFSSSSPTASTLLGKRKYEEVQKPAALDEVLSFSSCKKG